LIDRIRISNSLALPPIGGHRSETANTNYADANRKMVITGPFLRKTEFIAPIMKSTVVSTDTKVSELRVQRQTETTVAMDFGRITVDDDLVLYVRHARRG
jgi:signal recognition particle receptor subunit beta